MVHAIMAWLTDLRWLVVKEECVQHVMSAVLYHKELQELPTEHAHLWSQWGRVRGMLVALQTDLCSLHPLV